MTTTKRFRQEKVWERNLCATALRNLRIPNLKMMHTGGETGWPDRLFFIPGGRPYMIECKEYGERPDARQEYIHKILRDQGYDVDWFDNEKDAYFALVGKVEAARLSAQRR